MRDIGFVEEEEKLAAKIGKPAPPGRHEAERGAVTEGVATGLAVAGGLLLASASVGLLPIVEETLAVGRAADRFRLERPQGSALGDSAVAYECAGTRIVLSDDGAVDPALADTTRGRVAVRIGDTTLTTDPVAIHGGRAGPNRYWNRVVPYRWTEVDTGASECGIVYRLPPDTAAIERARSEAGPRLLLDELRGARPAWQHGLRFRAVRWAAGDTDTIRARDFGHDDWHGDPYGVYLANLLGTPIGLRNQSLSYWPSLLFPVIYPLGFSLLGLILVIVGLGGRFTAPGARSGAA